MVSYVDVCVCVCVCVEHLIQLLLSVVRYFEFRFLLDV
jgi:hypothetical protein